MPGSLISWTPAAASRPARMSTSAALAAPKAIRSIRLSADWRSRTTYCSGDPSAARKARPCSPCPTVRPQVLVKKSSCLAWLGTAKSTWRRWVMSRSGIVGPAFSGGLADQRGDAGEQAGDVALLVVEQPPGELVGGVDDGPGALEATGGEGCPQALVERRRARAAVRRGRRRPPAPGRRPGRGSAGRRARRRRSARRGPGSTARGTTCVSNQV